MLFRENAFYILGADITMTRAELALLESKRSLLSSEPSKTQNAAAQLSVPNMRIKHEISWLPDCEPEVACSLVDGIHQIKNNCYYPILDRAAHLSALSRFNYLLNIISEVAFEYSNEFANAVFDLIKISETIKDDNVQAVINRARAISGFPQLSSNGQKQISSLITELFEQAFHILIDRLAKMGESDYRSVIMHIAKLLRSSVSLHSSLAELIFNDYELRIKNDLQKYEEEIFKLASLRNHSVIVDRLGNDIQHVVDLLDQWGRLTYPLAIIKEAKGLHSTFSSELKLCNEVNELFSFLSRVFASEFEICYILIKAMRRNFSIYLNKKVLENYDRLCDFYSELLSE